MTENPSHQPFRAAQPKGQPIQDRSQPSPFEQQNLGLPQQNPELLGLRPEHLQSQKSCEAPKEKAKSDEQMMITLSAVEWQPFLDIYHLLQEYSKPQQRRIMRALTALFP